MVPVSTTPKRSRAVRHGVVLIAVAGLLAIALASVGAVAAQSPSAATTGVANCTDSIQGLVDAAKAGSRLELPACIARETLVVSKPLTIVGRPGAEIRGSDVWSDWSRQGTHWTSDRPIPELEQGGECRPSVDCRSPEQVFVDGIAQERTAADPSTGEFSLDEARHVVLGSDPSGRLVEVSTRTTWLAVSAADVTIDGVTFRDAANPPQTEHAALVVSDVDRFTLIRSHLFEAHGALLGIVGGSGHRIEDSELARGGQEGFAMTRIGDTVIARNRILDNNTAGFDSAWEAAGGKATRVRGLTVEGNTVSGNSGPGIWCDIDCRDVHITRNHTDHNRGPGIFFEVSTDGQIVDNAVFENGWGRPDWGWGGGILVSSAGDVSVTGNVLAWNADGISVISQDRADRPEDAGTNIDVSNNIIVGARQVTDTEEAYLIAWLQDWSGPLYRASSNNRGSGNRYWSSEPEPRGEHFHWSSDLTREADFAKTPVGAGGSYLSLEERDRILGGKGIETTPEEHVIPPQPLSRRSLVVFAAAAGLGGVVLLGLLVWFVRRRRRRHAPG